MISCPFDTLNGRAYCGASGAAPRRLWSAVSGAASSLAGSVAALRRRAGRFTLAAACLLFCSSAAAQVMPAEDWTPRARLILAQSCVGEAGFPSADSGECAAIAWVYLKRLRQVRRAGHSMTYAEMVRRYSQPIRHRRHLWIVSLRADLERPRGWPRRWPDWDQHFRERWQSVLDAVDRWASGDVPDACPRANHFGATTDRPSPRLRRARCHIRTRNIFYRLR